MSQTADYVNIKNLDDALFEIDALRNASKKNAKYRKIYISFVILFFLVAIVCICLLSINYELEDKTNDLKSEIRNIESKYVNENKENEDELITLKEKLSDLEDENENLAEKANWYDGCIAIVPDDGKNLYHKYGCKNLPSGRYSFWAYNNEAAESKGYTKCYICH